MSEIFAVIVIIVIIAAIYWWWNNRNELPPAEHFIDKKISQIEQIENIPNYRVGRDEPIGVY